MRILITGICGFVGSSLARAIRMATDAEVFGIDNLSRPGSETNRRSLPAIGVRVLHRDVRLPSEIDDLPAADWVIDAAASPSLLAGVDGRSTSRQVMEHNLLGTLNLLEYSKRHHAGFI